MGNSIMRLFRIVKYKINKKFVVLDAKTTIKELSKEVVINFFYGFLGNTTTVFILSKNPYMMGFSFFFFYSFLSIIINRNKYETNLGKYFIFPVSSAIGALTGCVLAFKYIHV